MNDDTSFAEIRAILKEVSEQVATINRERAEYQRDEEERRRAEEVRRSEEQARRNEEQTRRNKEQIRRSEEQARWNEDLARRNEEEARLSQGTKREIDRVAKIVGDIGNKFGSFTEGMAFSSMDKVLRKRFGSAIVTRNYKAEANTFEIDVLGLANGDVNTAVIVEVKSHLRKRDIEQMLTIIERFKRVHPEHATKRIFGILACVSGSTEIQQEAQQAGLFVASIHDEVFELTTPGYFVPRDFSQPLTPAQ